MHEVEQDEIERDSELGARARQGGNAADAARNQARNRIQKRHQRLREALLHAISDFVRSGRLSADDGDLARAFVERLLRRRQQRKLRSVKGREP
jgi:hypothetical protein